MEAHQIILGDCLDVMRAMPDNSVDLVITSPPYEDARTYGIGFSHKGQDWVDWCVERYRECARVSSGLVAWVVEGRTKNFRWTASPALLMADLHRAGISLRKPPVFARVGIPGSGGPDWWRNDYEFIVCSSKGKLPWSDNTATGQKSRYTRVGGEMSYRHQDGARKNATLRKQHTKREQDGSMRTQTYRPPELANPGNIIRCNVGGGRMGHALSHHNEAPFPESLVRPFVLSYCPPDGVVLDPFCGSGTTLAVAKKLGRRSIGIDVRDSQTAIAQRRIGDLVPELFT